MIDFVLNLLLAFAMLGLSGLIGWEMPATNMAASGKIQDSLLDLVLGVASVTMLAILLVY